MPRIRFWRSTCFVLIGAAACLLIDHGRAPLGVGRSVAGTRVKLQKVNNFLILAGGLGTPTSVAMVNQVVPRFSMMSNPTLPLIDVLDRTDLLVTTANNISGNLPVPGFPEGAVVRVRRTAFPTSYYAPPDADMCVAGACSTGLKAGQPCTKEGDCPDGISDNVALISENNNSFIIGQDAVVIKPGANAVLNTNPAQDDQFSGASITLGPNGEAESGRCGDDVQTRAVGTGGLVPLATVIAAGANGILETNPVGDDVAGPGGGCPSGTICAGLNGLAQSGRGGDDVQALACIGRFLNTTDIILDGGSNRLLQTVVGGDDVPVIVAAQDQTGSGAANFDSDTTACQNSDGSAVPACDDVQLVAPGTFVANKSVAVVGPGVNGALETPPNSGIIAANDLDADTAACKVNGNPADANIVPCDDIQVFAVGTAGLTATTRVVAPGPDNILQTPARFVSIPSNRDVLSFDAQAVQAGANRTAESGPPVGDDIQIVKPLPPPNQNVPPVSAPVGIESVVTMYPAVANRVDPISNPTNSGSVAFLSSSAFSIGSNGDNLPTGDSKLLSVGFPAPGPTQIGVFSGAEGAMDGSTGLLSGVTGFTYGGFGWTDLSFKRLTAPQLPPDLKDNVYFASRMDGGIAMLSYRRSRVTDVLASGGLNQPTDLAYLAPARALCIGAMLNGFAGVAAKCGPQDPVGADAGRLFVIESGTGRIALVPLMITNVTSDNGLCASLTGVSGFNGESGQGDFCDPKTGLRVQGGACPTGGTCKSLGVGLPNTRIVANPAGITFLSPQFVTNPVAIAMFTNAPVPFRGRVTSGSDGIAQTAKCNPNPPGSCDDVQVVPVGQGFPNAREIDAPPIMNNFNLQTTPQGDDVVIGGVTPTVPQIPGGAPSTTITAGPNGIAETTVCHNVVGPCTDIQNIPVGQGEPFSRIVEAGPNGVVDTTPTPQGDDRVVDSPTLLVANGDGSLVWMDLNGFDPMLHTGSPRLFVTPLTNITGMAVGNYVNGEGLQVLLTSTDFGGCVTTFDLTLIDNTPTLAATLRILTDLNDTISTKLDPSQVPIKLPASCEGGVNMGMECSTDSDCPLSVCKRTLPTGLTHVALDYYPGPDGFIGTPDDPHFNDPNSSINDSNISLGRISEPNEISTDGSGGNIYITPGTGGPRQKIISAGSFSVNTLNGPIDGILDGDATVDNYNFISGNIFINVGYFSSTPNSVLAGPDGVVQTTACMTPANVPIPNCDDIQLTLAGQPVFAGPKGGQILPGPNGVAESGIGGDDVQLQPVGKTFGTPGVTGAGVPYTVWTANVAAVGPGPNGVLNTCPGGDDTVGTGSTGIMALCPGVVASLASCPTDFMALGIGCTVPTASCPANTLCTGPNGVVNTGLGADDTQAIQPGTTGLAASAVLVAPGTDNFIETSPGGDDMLGGGQALDVVIEPGPDSILQTPPAPGDVAGRLTPISIVDLDIFASSRPITTLGTPTMPYAFLDPAGANSGVIDINLGKTSNALDAAVDGVFPNSSSFFGPSFESPTGELDFYARNISLTAAVDNVTGIVTGRGVDRNSRLPALSLLYLDASLSPVNNALVGSAIVGQQVISTPANVYAPDPVLKGSSKSSSKVKAVR